MLIFARVMPVPPPLLEKSVDVVREELAGFPDETVDIVMQFRDDGEVETLTKMVLLR